MVWSEPSPLSVEHLIQNATKYLINNCPLPPDERIKGLFSQGNSKASISGVKFNKAPGACMILPLPLQNTPKNIVSRLIHFDTFVFHPSKWDRLPGFDETLITTLIKDACHPYAGPLHVRMRDIDDGTEGIIHEMLSILLQRLSPLAHLIVIQLWNEEEEYDTGECWAALQALSTTKSMTDRNFHGEDVKPDVITVALQESLLLPLRNDVHITNKFVCVSPVDAKGSSIYKSLLSESDDMTQDNYMDSVLDRTANHPQFLYNFFQEDCKKGIRGRSRRAQTLQTLSSVSIPFDLFILL